MTEKCGVCQGNVEKIFLEKIRGTFVKSEKGKKVAVCSACQKKNSLEKIRQAIQ